MNMKKFISAASALTIAASAFAGMAVTALADSVTSIYSNDFEAATDFSVAGRTDGTTYNGTTTPTNTKNSNVAGRYGVGGDARISVNNISSMSNYKDAEGNNASYIDVSFDLKYDPGTGAKTSSFVLCGTSQTKVSYSSNSDYRIFDISMKDDNKNGISSVTINGNNVTDKIASTGALEQSSSEGSTTGWMHVDVSIDFVQSNVTYKITRNSAEIIGETTTSFLDSDAKAPKVLDSVALIANKTNTGLYMDNLTIDRVDKEIAKAKVTFDGNTSEVYVNNSLVPADGIELPAGEYSYYAKADSCITKYGTIEITDEDVENGSKTITVNLDTVPAAPVNTNNTESNVSISSLLSDGFTNSYVNVASNVDIQHGDKVVIEYDLFVTGSNSFNVTLKGSSNSTGANTEFVANQNEVLVQNQENSSKWNSIGTFSPNQWVHVKMSFDAKAPTVEGPPESNIRTGNVSVVITPTEGSVIEYSNINARNLGEGFIDNNNVYRSYNFESIDFSGTANIANAEIYVLGERTPSFKVDAGTPIVANGTEDFADKVATGYIAKVTNEGAQGMFSTVNVSVDAGTPQKAEFTGVTLPKGAEAYIGLILNNVDGSSQNVTITVE